MSDSKVEAKRDQAYRCPECDWTGVKSQCIMQYVKKHYKLPTNSFGCTLCNFKGGTEDQLRVRAKSKWHKKRITNGELYDERKEEWFYNSGRI